MVVIDSELKIGSTSKNATIKKRDPVPTRLNNVSKIPSVEEKESCHGVIATIGKKVCSVQRHGTQSSGDIVIIEEGQWLGVARDWTDGEQRRLQIRLSFA